MSLPVIPASLALFIAYLFHCKYAPSTVTTYVSAIGYFHRLAGYDDPSKVAYIKEMLKGYSKLGRTLDARLPITLPILQQLVQVTDTIVSSQYMALLYKAMFTLAFHAFLRIGEITVSNNTTTRGNVISINQITTAQNASGTVDALQIAFKDFKHNYNKSPRNIRISRQLSACPVSYMVQYLSNRGPRQGPLFIDNTGSPIQRSHFSKMLNQCLQACCLDPRLYKGHSFRIGAATFAAQQGMSDTQIRLLGRWKSDAFKKYIRVDVLSI